MYNASAAGHSYLNASGPFAAVPYPDLNNYWYSRGSAAQYAGSNKFSFNLSRVVPAGAHVSPRAYGSLLCVYLGNPAS